MASGDSAAHSWPPRSTKRHLLLMSCPHSHSPEGGKVPVPRKPAVTILRGVGINAPPESVWSHQSGSSQQLGAQMKPHPTWTRDEKQAGEASQALSCERGRAITGLPLNLTCPPPTSLSSHGLDPGARSQRPHCLPVHWIWRGPGSQTGSRAPSPRGGAPLPGCAAVASCSGLKVWRVRDQALDHHPCSQPLQEEQNKHHRF